MAREFYFAWVDHGGTTFGPVHHVNDEVIVGFEITHQQNEAAGLRIGCRNPRVGPLHSSRKQWAWVSHRLPDNSVVPLFHGRLVAMPTEFAEDLIEFEFTARPADAEQQKAALAETLKVPPFWDKVFIDPATVDDPDVVLTARPQLWHFGRTDKLVTVSDILVGEDGTLALDPGAVLSDTLEVDVGKPTRKVKVTASVEWNQSATGTVDMSKAVVSAFGAAGSPVGFASSYTGQGLEATWPLYGASIGGGWTMDRSRPNLTNTDIDEAHILSVTLNPMNDTPPEDLDLTVPGAYEQWLAERMADPIREARFARWDFRPTVVVRYAASRGRKEVLSFELTADMQPIEMDQPEESQTVELTVNSTIVGDPDPVTNEVPLGNLRKRSYFDSDRGQDSIAFLLNLARSHMLMGARCVEISIGLTDPLAIVNLSCRKDVVLSLPELPGGSAGGKIIGYSMRLVDGALSATVSFAATVGRGNALAAPDDGEPSYVEEPYVVDTYQVFYGESLQPVAGEVEYKRPSYQPNDDGLNFDGLTPTSIVADLFATALLTFAGAGSVGNTITIGGRTYTLQTTLSGANQVKVGVDNEETARNVAAAIERVEEQEGVTFGAGTAAHAQVGASASDGILRATARVGGSAGNSIAVAAVGPMTWDHPTLQGGAKGLRVLNGPAEQEAALTADPTPGSVQMAIDRLNANFTLVQMALKPVTGGPFQTDITLQVSELMVPKTIDLEAA